MRFGLFTVAITTVMLSGVAQAVHQVVDYSNSLQSKEVSDKVAALQGVINTAKTKLGETDNQIGILKEEKV